eukprot:c8098_g1_i2.p1 GENE.c8098_g1_i2~~c8098_g1_i2.p1  ORF type:complete len:985 (+),score=183.88 c8098_g1_i2:1681-4635(+)
MTTSQIVCKDFTDPNHFQVMQKAAQLMVKNLASSLALVTCKEPLRVSIASHLRVLLSKASVDSQTAETIVVQATNDNLELGCRIIERAAADKAVRDVDTALTEAHRRRLERVDECPLQLPEALILSKHGMRMDQLRIYDDFAKLSNNNAARTQAPMATPTANAPSPVPSAMQQNIEKCMAVLEKIYALTQPQRGLTQAQPVQHMLLQLITHLRSFVLALPPREMESVASALSKPALHRFLTNPIFVSRPEDAATLTLGCEAHLAILEFLCQLPVGGLLQKELTTQTLADPKDVRHPPAAIGLLVRRNVVNISDTNVVICKTLAECRQAAPAQSTADIKWCIHVLRYIIIPATQSTKIPLRELCPALDALRSFPQNHPLCEQVMQAWNELMPLIPASTTSAFDSEQNPVQPQQQQLQQQQQQQSALEPNLQTPTTSLVDLQSQQSVALGDSPALREKSIHLLDEWIRALNQHQQQSNANPGSVSPACANVLHRMHQEGLLKGDDVTDRFFRICIIHSISLSKTKHTPGQADSISYLYIDGFSRLVGALFKITASSSSNSNTPPVPPMTKAAVMTKALSMLCVVLINDSETTAAKLRFDQRPYYRFVVNWLTDLNAPQILQDTSSTLLFTVLTAVANLLHSLQPSNFASFAFAWMELMSHRLFMPRLLGVKPQGWPLFHKLLVDLFKFLEPCLRTALLNDTVRLLYKGCLRILLVLLHDFPEFLCEYHFSLCDAIPPSCVQLRNLILSAFPRNMRLPDPFTPNLKVDLLPEIFESPRIMSVVHQGINKDLKDELDNWIKSHSSTQFLATLPQRLMLPADSRLTGTRYNVPTINALVLYVGMQAIEIMQRQKPGVLSPFTQTFAVELYQFLVTELDPEGRYYVLNAMANQLRYPNNHTHYFSWILLYIFAESNQEIVKEQITRVLLERLIVHRPHPWGLLITFIELIKNPRYDFWNHSFTQCAPEIKKLFESVAATCGSNSPSAETS